MLTNALITMVDAVTTVQTLMDLTTVVVLMDLNCHQTIVHVKVTKEIYNSIMHAQCIIIGIFLLHLENNTLMLFNNSAVTHL